MFNILVLCTGNSARSILLEAILEKHGRGKVQSYSAGSKPVGKVNPASIQLLKSLGYNTELYASKSWNDFSKSDSPKMDMVITVCGNARDEECPYWPGAPLQTHWGVDDPADVTEPPQAVQAAFQKAYDVLEKRALAFLALDFENVSIQDLKSEIDQIGKLYDE